MKYHFVAALLAVAFVVTGCKKDDNPAQSNPTPTSTTYVGTIASGTESGSVSVTVSLAKGTSGGVTGTLKIVHPAAATITLSGTFSNNTFSAAGGGYAFSGSLASGNISGTYTAPNGAGQFTTQSSTSNSIQVYAGTFTSTVAGQPSGIFNLVINGSTVTGLAVPSHNQSTTTLAGTLAGPALTIRDAASNTGIATGTMSGTSISGTYDAGSNRGNWSGALVQ